MNKVTEKVVPAMNAAELERLIVDHYTGEAQTLTTGAEANLLKFGELRGTLTDTQAERWGAIRKEFARQKLMGGADDDPVARVTGVLAGLADQLGAIQGGIDQGVQGAAAQRQALAGIQQALSTDRKRADLARLSEQLGAVRAAIEAGQQAPGAAEALSPHVEKVGNWLGHIHRALSATGPRDEQLGQIAAQLGGVRQSMQQTTVGLQQLRVLDWLSPQLDGVQTPADVARVRRAVLEEAVGALDGGDQHAQIDPQDTALAAALPVIHGLVLGVADLVRERLPAEQQEPFMDNLRRQVAAAVNSLAAEERAAGSVE